jgi:hypothetical protein
MAATAGHSSTYINPMEKYKRCLLLRRHWSVKNYTLMING